MNRRLLVGLTVLAAGSLLLVATATSTARDVAGDGERADPIAQVADAAASVFSLDNAAEPTIGYGMNGIYAPDVEREAGVSLSYGQVWVGSWVTKPGRMTDFTDRVSDIRDNGLVPVVEWWYFGDQISINAVTKGLPDGRNVARWHALGPQVAKAACEASGGEMVFVVETEFNKGGVAGLEAFDGELAKHVAAVKAACPTATVAIGFGAWGLDDWGRFDRAAAASDAVGFQLMRSLAKDGWSEYEDAPDVAVASARKLQELFGKPIVLHDVALSSYGKGGSDLQAKVLDELLDNREELQDAGVVMILYRSVRDTPSMAKGNYYGAGEAYWGLWTSTGAAKPAFGVWVAALD